MDYLAPDVLWQALQAVNFVIPGVGAGNRNYLEILAFLVMHVERAERPCRDHTAGKRGMACEHEDI